MEIPINTTIGVRKVKTVAFSIDEAFYIKGQDEKLVYEYQHHINLNTELEHIIFTLRVYWFYPEAGRDYKLVDCHVATTFYIGDFKSYIKEKEGGLVDLSLSPEVWTIIVGLSFSHLRAAQSMNVAGTIYEHFIIPIIDPKVFTSQLLNFEKNTQPEVEIKEKAST